MPWDDFEAEPVTWAYVAGFTDGEGSIRMQTKQKDNSTWSAFEVILTQKKQNAWVLYEIKDFLDSEGIHSSIYGDGRYGTKRNPNEQYYLFIRRVKDVYNFIIAVQPYLIVKAADAKRIRFAIEQKKVNSTRKVYAGW